MERQPITLMLARIAGMRGELDASSGLGGKAAEES